MNNGRNIAILIFFIAIMIIVVIFVISIMKSSREGDIVESFKKTLSFGDFLMILFFIIIPVFGFILFLIFGKKR